MPPKNSGGSTKFPGGHKLIHRTAQTAFVRVVTRRIQVLYMCKSSLYQVKFRVKSIHIVIFFKFPFSMTFLFTPLSKGMNGDNLKELRTFKVYRSSNQSCLLKGTRKTQNLGD